MSMTALEKKRLEVNFANVRAARLANELKIAELKDVILRLEKDIEISLSKEADLTEQLKKE